MPHDQPNILLITTDQQHWRLMSCAGDPYVQTPNLDRLAATSLRYDRCYSPNPVCVPCRYSFMTGMMPHHFDGLETNLKGKQRPMPRIADCIDTKPMGAMLRDAGYATVMGGKAHIEGAYAFTPEEEVTYGFRCLSSDSGEAMADACADFLGHDQDKPFLLWASFDGPHEICYFLRQREIDGVILDPVPLPDNAAPTRDEPDHWRAFREGTLGEESTLEFGLNRAYAQQAHQWDDDTWTRYRAIYRYRMEQVDKYIGKVLAALDASRVANDTVVIFTSDHGDHDGAHRLAMKRSFYEESVHIPLLIRDPQCTDRAGSIDSDRLICNGLDLLPTMCDYAGMAIPDSLVGQSLRPGADVCTRDFVVSQTAGGRMVRTSDFKYAIMHADGESQEVLFDLTRDPGEMQNLSNKAAFQSEVAKHRAYLSAWCETNQDPQGLAYLNDLSLP